MKTTIALAAASLLLIAGAASARDLSFNAGITTDYVTRGSSQTNHQPAYSVGAELTTDNGFYAGAWTSNVDFGDGTDQEIDLYGGYRTKFAGFGLDFSGATYQYSNDPGKGLDMVEALAVATRDFGKVSTTTTIAYSPDYFNLGSSSLWYELGASYPLTSRLNLSGSVGYQELSREAIFPSYSTYNVGLGYKLNKNLTVDVRFTDSDLDKSVVGFFADDTVSVSLNAAF